MGDENTTPIDNQIDSYIRDPYVVSQLVPPHPKPHPGPYLPVFNGQCVSFIQAHGFADYRGDAYEWKKYINSEIGWVGYAVLLDEGPFGHLALITGTNDGYQLVEQNYIDKYVVSTRFIPFDYNRIVGFIKKPSTK